MKERLENLKNLAETTGNSYLLTQLTYLEMEISMAIVEAEIKIINKLRE